MSALRHWTPAQLASLERRILEMRAERVAEAVVEGVSTTRALRGTVRECACGAPVASWSKSAQCSACNQVSRERVRPRRRTHCTACGVEIRGVGGGQCRACVTTLRRRVLEYLQRQPEVTSQQLVAMGWGEYSAVTQVLCRLHGAGLLVRVRRGVYARPTP